MQDFWILLDWNARDCYLSYENIRGILAVENAAADPFARAKGSTATGLFQLTKPAYMDVCKHFPARDSFWPESYDGNGKPDESVCAHTLFDPVVNLEFFFAYVSVIAHVLDTRDESKIIHAYHYGMNCGFTDDKDGYVSRVRKEAEKFAQRPGPLGRNRED